MLTRRNMMKATLAATAATLATAGTGQAASSLNWTHFPAGENGFYRAPVLVYGPTEALLIDGGFTLSDGRAIADAIKAGGRKLTAIYVSQSDPDYYFSLAPIVAAFPDAKVLAASETIAAIRGNVEKKLAAWSPQLKDNGPKALADVVFPAAYDALSIGVDGNSVEIVAAKNLPNRRYLHVPALNAIFGGVLVFSDVHVWTADTQSDAAVSAWIAALDEIAALAPEIIIPGHMTVDAPLGLAAVDFTKSYLLAFAEAKAKSADSAALKAAMLAKFPGLGMGVALDIGAKVAKGEMQWG